MVAATLRIKLLIDAPQIINVSPSLNGELFCERGKDTRCCFVLQPKVFISAKRRRLDAKP
jgi:hypothetical protein